MKGTETESTPDTAMETTVDNSETSEVREESTEEKQEDYTARIDSLSRRLFLAMVEKDGRLIDPTDMPYSADLVEDDAAMKAAIDELLSSKPYLKREKFRSDIGAGNRGEKDLGQFDLLTAIKAASGI